MKYIEREYLVNDQGMIVEEIDHYEVEEYDVLPLPAYPSNQVVREPVWVAA